MPGRAQPTEAASPRPLVGAAAVQLPSENPATVMVPGETPQQHQSLCVGPKIMLLTWSDGLFVCTHTGAVRAGNEDRKLVETLAGGSAINSQIDVCSNFIGWCSARVTNWCFA